MVIKRLKASTLVESVISITILAIVLTVISSSVSPASNSENHILGLNAKYKSIELFEQMMINPNTSSFEYEYPGIRLIGEVIKLDKWSDMSIITITAFDIRERELFKIQRIIPIGDE